MRNFFLSRLMMVMIVTIIATLTTNTINAQIPGNLDLTLRKPESDGKIHYSVGDFGAGFRLYEYDNTYTTPVNEIISNLMYTNVYFIRKGQRWVFRMDLMVHTSVNNLNVKMRLDDIVDPITGKKGNFTCLTNANGTGIFQIFSLKGNTNDTSMIINTNDGTWIPTVYDGQSGYFTKQWVLTTDSIPLSLCDANGFFINR